MITDTIAELVKPRSPGPCISLYATNASPAHLRDARLRALLDETERQLGSHPMGTDRADRAELLSSASMLFAASVRSLPPGSSIGVFVTPGWSGSAAIAHAVPDSVSIAEVFNVRPLLETRSVSAFHLIALHADHVTAMRGDGAGLSTDEALPTREQARSRKVGMDGATVRPLVEPDHSRPLGSGDVAHEALRAYFHVVAGVYRQRHPRLTEPVILAGTERNVAMFRQAAHDILPTWIESISIDIDGLDRSNSQAQLLEAVRPLLERAASAELAQARHSDASRPRLSEAMAIVEAAAKGQVETLYLVNDARAWGVPHGDAGAHALPSAGDEELLNRAAVETLRHHGHVRIVLAGDLGPGEKAVAVLRYLADRYAEQALAPVSAATTVGAAATVEVQS